MNANVEHVVARNWGGDGIERFLNPDESIVLRFGNYFLTDYRLARYRTANSRFEFMDLSGLEIQKRDGAPLKVILALGLAVLSVFYIASGILQGIPPLSIAIIGSLVIIGTFGYAYYILGKLASDSLIVKSRKTGEKWKLRTFGTESGKRFISAVTRASDSGRP